MANLKTIQIPAEVQLSVKNQAQTMRGLHKELQDIFANADPGSSFGKSLQRAITQVEKKLNSADSLLEKNFFSEADLGKTANLLNNIADIFSEIATLANRTSTKTLGFESQELIEAKQLLSDLQKRIASIKKDTKIGAIEGIMDKDQVKAMTALSKKTGFSAGKTFNENYNALSKSLGQVTDDYIKLQLEAENAQAVVEKTSKAMASAKNDLNAAKGELQARKDLNIDFAKQIMSVKVSGQGATKENIAKQYQDMLGQMLSGVDSERYAPLIAGWLNIPESALHGTASEIVNNLRIAIEAAMNNSPASKNKLRMNAKSILNGESAAFQKDVAYAEADNKVAAATAAMNSAEQDANEAISTLQVANNNISQTATLLATIRQQMAELKELQAEYNALVDSENAEKLNQAKKTVNDLDKRDRSGGITGAGKLREQGYEASGAANRSYNRSQQARLDAEAMEQAREANQRESEQFVANLKQSIGHWMSAQQIINIVKNGIRQAYEDIKGLDTAMTNIAVVTDMSISDLWGKINDYMSIAQQYGVTTQGVYEVSQLYYQQGLSTNEVMAATTETLKMARIAGMSYKDAADAMTVAIRSFKMEMEDAGHVTDVYSKVAAITASDSEELAIAMSKTASSAESVGSSFENTTAMLAVMVETTRESAQNLGSALKSIISRYGEMKTSGAMIDEDGNEVAFNKVDTALASVGISIKNAQGQFRDFDEVIFELSEKWDSLDKNTQRYIATIMAGNRQQSRFIALVDNWERLNEVANAAQDSEDAGLLQYAKTLDSLDTKLNNIKTSFQEFYMNIINGPVIGGILEGVNKLIQGFNKLGSFQGILNLVGIIRGLKVGLKAVVNTFGNSFSNIITSWKNTQNELLILAKQSGAERGRQEALAEAEAYNATIQQGRVAGYQNSQISLSAGQTTGNTRRRRYQRPSSRTAAVAARKEQAYNNMSWFDKRQYGMQTGKVEWKNNSWGGSGWGQGIAVGGALLGGALQTWGASAAEDDARTGAWLSGAGNVFQGASIGAMAGPWGALAGAILGFATSLPSIIEASDKLNRAQEKIDKAKERLEEANLERAQKKETSRELESTLENLKELQAARYQSEEAEKAFIEASNAAAEKFPQLVSGYTSTGDAIIDVIGDVTRSEAALIQARKDAAKAALQAAAAELDTAMAEDDKVDVKTGKAEAKISSLVANADSKSGTHGGVYIPGGGLSASTSGTSLWRSQSPTLKDNIGSFFSTDFVFPFVNETFGEVVGGQKRILNNEEANTAQSFFKGIRKNYELDTANDYIDTLLYAIFDLQDQQMRSNLANLSEEEQYDWYSSFLETATAKDLIERTSSFKEQGMQLTMDEAEAILKVLKDDLTAALRRIGAITTDQEYSDFVGFAELEAQSLKQQQIIRDKRANVATNYALDYAVQEDPLYEGTWREISTASDIIIQKAMANAGISEDSFIRTGENAGQFTEDAKTAGQERIFEQTLDEYWAIFNRLNDAQIEKLESLQQLASNQDISEGDYEKQLGIILKDNQELIDLFLEDYLNSRINTTSRILTNALQLDNENWFINFDNKQLFSALPDYDTWLQNTGLEDNETNRAEYDNEMRKEIASRKAKALEAGDYFAYALMELSTADSEALLGILTSEAELINKNPNTNMAKVARVRLNKITEWYEEIGKRAAGEDSIFKDVDDSEIQEFYNIIGEGIDTYDNARRLEAWAAENNVLLGDIEQYAYEAYEIRLQNIIDKGASAVEAIQSLAEKNEKGFSWEEANAHLAQIQKINPEKAWDDIFSINEQGIIVLKDFSSSVQDLQASALVDLQEQKNHLDSIISTIQKSPAQLDRVYEYVADESREFSLFDAEKWARTFANDYGITLSDDEITGLAYKIQNHLITSEEELIKYFESLADNAEFATETFIKQIQSARASNAFSSWTKQFSTETTTKDLIESAELENLQSIWQKNAASYLDIGWTEEDLKNLTNEEWTRLLGNVSRQDADLSSIAEQLGPKGDIYWSDENWRTYYQAQADLLEANGAQLDKYGKLIIKNWEDWAHYIATSQGFTEGNEEYNQILAEAELQGKVALESYASSLEDGIAEITTSLINNGEIEYSQLQGIIDTLQSRGVLESGDYESLMSAYEKLKNGTTGSYTEFLDEITRLVKEAGLGDFDTSEISAAIRDAYAELISSLASALKDGIEGTLSNEEYTNLARRYGLSGDLRTSSGVSLSAQSQQTMAVEMYRAAQASGSTIGAGEDIWAAFKDAEGSILGTYEDIEAEIERISNGTDANTEEAREYLKVLEQIKAAARLDPDYSIFAFMEQDWGGAGADTFDSFASSIDKVKSSLQSLKEGEYIDYKDFANMIGFLNSSGQWEKFAEDIGFTGESYQEFVRTVIANTDEFGKVNLEGIALQMGVGIDTAMESMTSSMTEGLKKVAEDQIKYLKGLEAMLEAMVALEKIGDLGLDITFEMGGTLVTKQLFEIADIWEDLSENEQIDLVAKVRAQIGNISNSEGGKEIMAAFGLGDIPLESIFDGLTDETYIQYADAFGTLIENMKTLTEGQSQHLSSMLHSAIEDYIIFDSENNIAGLKDGWQSALLKAIAEVDYAKILNVANTEVATALQGKSITVGGATLTLKGAEYKLDGTLDDANKEAIVAEINKQLAESGAKFTISDITVNEDGSVNFVKGSTADEIGSLQTDFQTLEEAATAVETAFASLQEILNNFAVSDAFREFVSLVTSLHGGGETDIIGENAVAENSGISLSIDTEQAKTTLQDFEDNVYGPLRQELEKPISLILEAPGMAQQNKNNEENNNLGQVIKITQEVVTSYLEDPNNPKPVVESPQDIIYNWVEGEKIPERISDRQVYFRWVARNPLQSLYNRSNPITVYYELEPSESASSGVISGAGGGGLPNVKALLNWTGTMNNISGSAYADGSIGRLYSGAELANKVLVGELGPELAVYDGQYHMLGARGAEFVNLPSDAIIFNHKQTEGILNGQFNIRGTAMAEGNVSGPAYASGAAAGALATIRDAISVWQGLLHDLSTSQLLDKVSKSGGGGTGGSLTAVTSELQEWFNLSKQIEKTEIDINNLIAERNNLMGGEALVNLRKQQQLLYKQIDTYKVLEQYQQAQLQRQKDHILNNEFWKKYFTFDESDTLQFINGNEANGGKGALEILADFNEWSGEEQQAYLQSINYHATNQEGEQLEGTELAQFFIDELNRQIDEYTSLYKTVMETNGTLEDLLSSINDIEQEIKDTTIEVEETIYDSIVEAWELQIEKMEEQADLIEEANKSYIDGLKNALNEEKNMYSSNESIADREALQRRLALLRRSGGSANEIYDLEKQLDGMLKDEYFKNQEKLIENISEANEEQLRRLEEQIKLQEEALEYQQEHGIIWSKVYEILQGETEAIISFIQGNNSDFMNSSLLQQEEMLKNLFDKVGFVKENQKLSAVESKAEKELWNTGIATSGLSQSNLAAFNSMSDKDKEGIKQSFLSSYALDINDGKTHEEALKNAQANINTVIKNIGEAAKAKNNEASANTGSTSINYPYGKASATSGRIENKAEGNHVKAIQYALNKLGYGNEGIADVDGVYGKYTVSAVKKFQKAQGITVDGIVGDETREKFKLLGYKQGGLVDYTGPAFVHGSPSKPEAFLNAKQTAMISEAIRTVGDGGALDSIKATLAALNTTIKSIVNNNNIQSSSFTVAPGAVTIQVAQLNDSYDVEELSKDVMNRMVAIASKTTNRGVNRR